jgi:hypothetical protein
VKKPRDTAKSNKVKMGKKEEKLWKERQTPHEEVNNANIRS